MLAANLALILSFFFPTSDVVHDRKGTGELSFRLDCVDQIELILGMGGPQNCFGTYSLAALATALVWALCGQVLYVFASKEHFLCGGHMPPSFARARQQPKGHNPSTAELTTCGWSFLVLSWAYSMTSATHLLMFSSKSRTAVRTLTPAILAAMAVQAVNGTADGDQLL